MNSTPVLRRLADARSHPECLRVVVICEGMDHHGGVATVAWNQAIRLAGKYPVLLLSEAFTEERLHHSAGVSCLKVRSPAFRFLRRYSHLPRKLGFIFEAMRMVNRATQAGESFILICHSHPTAAIASWWLNGCRKPLIIMVAHGDIFDRPPHSYDPLLTWLYRITTPFAYRKSARIVAISPYMSGTIERHGIPAEKISLIPNGIDPSEIGVDEHSIAPGTFAGPLRLLFVGRIEPIKGLEYLLAACEELERERIDFTLAIAGNGPSSYVDELRQSILAAGLQERILWIGSIPRKKLFSIYSQYHLLIVPSINEPFGMVVLEAMASGLPVVASCVGGIPMMIEEGVTGLMVATANPRDLAVAIGRLDQDRTLLAGMALRSRERAGWFSWERNVEALSREIDRLGRTAGAGRE